MFRSLILKKTKGSKKDEDGWYSNLLPFFKLANELMMNSHPLNTLPATTNATFWAPLTHHDPAQKAVLGPLFSASLGKEHRDENASAPAAQWEGSRVCTKQGVLLFCYMSPMKQHLVGGWTTHLKNIRQIGSFPQVEVKINKTWNHQLDT